jgi:hypothetical protein
VAFGAPTHSCGLPTLIGRLGRGATTQDDTRGFFQLTARTVCSAHVIRGAANSGCSPYDDATTATQPRVPPWARTIRRTAASISARVGTDSTDRSLTNSACARATVSNFDDVVMAGTFLVGRKLSCLLLLRLALPASQVSGAGPRGPVGRPGGSALPHCGGRLRGSARSRPPACIGSMFPVSK